MKNPFLDKVSEIAQRVDALVVDFLEAKEKLASSTFKPAWEYAASMEYSASIESVEMFAYLLSLSATDDNWKPACLSRKELQRFDLKVRGGLLKIIATNDDVEDEIVSYLEMKDQYGSIEFMLKQACMEITGEIPF